MPSTISGSAGIAPSQWTTAGRPSSPLLGQMGWNITLNQLEVFVGSYGWASIAKAGLIIDFVVIGAGGGGGGADGGNPGSGGGTGGIVYGTTQLTPSSSYYVYIGGGGGAGASNAAGSGGGTAGSNGGAVGGNAGASGASGGGAGSGGWSAIAFPGSTSYLALAGGGGGGGGGGEGVQDLYGGGGGGNQYRGVNGTSMTGAAGYNFSGDGGGGGAGGGGYFGGLGQAADVALRSSGGGQLSLIGTQVSGNDGSGTNGSTTSLPVVFGSWWSSASYGQGAAVTANGSQGVIILRYPGATQILSGGTVTIASGYVTHTFTSNGTFTT